MKITIAFITARADPRLDWLIDTLAPQLVAGDEIDILVIDALWPRGLLPPALDDALPSEIMSVRSVLPKPNIWQGMHRIAPRNYFANAVSRNTAIVHCQRDFIAFLDDRARLLPGWLDVVREAEQVRRYVVCGPYDKIEDGPVDTNNVSRDVAPGLRVSIDHRKEQRPKGLRQCPGGWLFGGNFAAPLEWLLEVNGCEEGCDPTGQEDCILGLMLKNAGRPIDFSIDMAVVQDRTGDVHVPAFPRLDKGLSPNDRSHATIDRFGKRKRTEFTPDLRKLRELALAGMPLPAPNPAIDHRDWYDQMLIKETPMETINV